MLFHGLLFSCKASGESLSVLMKTKRQLSSCLFHLLENSKFLLHEYLLHICLRQTETCFKLLKQKTPLPNTSSAQLAELHELCWYCYLTASPKLIHKEHDTSQLVPVLFTNPASPALETHSYGESSLHCETAQDRALPLLHSGVYTYS